MIKIETPCFIATSNETQTETKVSLLTVNYSCYLGSKTVENITVPQGYIKSFVYNETMNSIMSSLDEDQLFTGNILNELTVMYIDKLQDLNPSVTFVNTLITE